MSGTRAFTITELERETGVPRSTIYYYVREGLLPAAQKAAASRAVYSQAHVDLVNEITRLKAQGWPLRVIRGRLIPQLELARALEVDLVAEQNERVRQAILNVAAHLFARKGYKRTRVAEIIKDAGVTWPVFYGHFSSKQELFVESFGVFVGWMRRFLEGQLLDEPDAGARDLARVRGFLGVRALSPDLTSLVRSEALHGGGEMRQVAINSYKALTENTLADLTRLREAHGRKLKASDELIAFGLLGGIENMVMRLSWDDCYSTRDLLWTTLSVFLAVEALYSGRLDLSQELARYSDLIERLCEAPPPVPPPVAG